MKRIILGIVVGMALTVAATRYLRNRGVNVNQKIDVLESKAKELTSYVPAVSKLITFEPGGKSTPETLPPVKQTVEQEEKTLEMSLESVVKTETAVAKAPVAASDPEETERAWDNVIGRMMAID